MMFLFLFIFGPPIITLLSLGFLPQGRAFKTGIIIFAILWIISASVIYPQLNTAGSNDFLHGVELFPLWSSFIAAVFAVALRFGFSHFAPDTKRSVILPAVITAIVLLILLVFFFFRF